MFHSWLFGILTWIGLRAGSSLSLCARTRARACVRACVRVCVHALHMHGCWYVSVYWDVCFALHACVRVCVRACACVSVCVSLPPPPLLPVVVLCRHAVTVKFLNWERNEKWQQQAESSRPSSASATKATRRTTGRCPASFFRALSNPAERDHPSTQGIANLGMFTHQLTTLVPFYNAAACAGLSWRKAALSSSGREASTDPGRCPTHAPDYYLQPFVTSSENCPASVCLMFPSLADRMRWDLRGPMFKITADRYGKESSFECPCSQPWRLQYQGKWKRGRWHPTFTSTKAGRVAVHPCK